MTKDEKLKRIEDIEKELAELKESIKEEDENNQLCWKPKSGEKYYYIPSYEESFSDAWENHPIEEKRLVIGNIFKTKEEADFAIGKLKVIHELKQFAIPSKKWKCGTNWSIGFDFCTQTLIPILNGNVKYGEIYFSTKEIAHKAIEAVGEERIKKYYLEVE